MQVRLKAHDGSEIYDNANGNKFEKITGRRSSPNMITVFESGLNLSRLEYIQVCRNIFEHEQVFW